MLGRVELRGVGPDARGGTCSNFAGVVASLTTDEQPQRHFREKHALSRFASSLLQLPSPRPTSARVDTSL